MTYVECVNDKSQKLRCLQDQCQAFIHISRFGIAAGKPSHSQGYTTQQRPNAGHNI